MELIIYTIKKFFNLIFNNILIAPGVSFGHVILVCAIFLILVKGLLNLPNKGGD